MSAPRGGRVFIRAVVGAVLVAALAVLPLPVAAIGPVAGQPQAIDLLPPVGVADSLTMKHDRVAVVPPPGVLGNDLDLDGGARAVLDAPPTHGTVQLRADGGYTYTPHAGYVGADQFRYHATSLLLNSLTTPVRITVTNVLPVAVDDAYSGPYEQNIVVAAPGVLANDRDNDGDPLRAELRGGVSNGSVNLAANGGFVYDPGGSFSGTTSFNYRIWDGAAWSAEATVTLTIFPPPTPTPPPTPAPTPTPTPTPPPTPTPTPPPIIPTLPPSIIPTLPPSIIPTLPPSIIPTLPPILPTPTPRPTTRPTPVPTPTPTPGPSTSPTPGPSTSPTPGPSTSPTPGPSGSPGPSASPAGGIASPGGPSDGPPVRGDGPFALPAVQIDPFDDGFGGFGAFGGFEWVVPAVLLAVPGLLLIVALVAQAAIGVIWLPMVRRHLAGVGLRRRRRQTVRA